MTETRKRAKLLMKNPNPAYLSWLEEWLLEARESGQPKRVKELALAAESLKKFPVRLSSAKECIILQNFSRQLVDEMEQREKAESGKPDWPKRKTPVKPVSAVSSPTKAFMPISSSKTVMTMGISMQVHKHPMAKTACPEKVSKTKAWSPSKSTKSNASSPAKSLNSKAPSPAKSPKSKELSPAKVAKCNGSSTKTWQAGVSSSTEVDEESHRKQLSVIQDLIAPRKTTRKKENYWQEDSDQAMDTQEAQAAHETIIFAPGSFRIILLIDTGEKGFLSSVSGFSDPELSSEVRHLKVGDYAWVARGPSDKELLLPFLVERKRLDDLSKSVKDGRFSEQKFRLKMSNIPNIIYLIENHNVRGNTQSIIQGISNMMIKDLFTVKETRDSLDSMRYLANMTKFLSLTTVGKTLVSSTEYDPECSLQSDLVRLPEFGYFFSGMGKLRTFTTKEMFTKQLVQLHGLSADKAWAIVSKYPTPKALIEAFRESGPSLLSDLTCGLLNRKLGQNISSVLYKFYTSEDFQ